MKRNASSLPTRVSAWALLLLGLTGVLASGHCIWVIFDARSWPMHPCELLESGVAGGGIRRIDVVYRYEAGGGSRTGRRYEFFSRLSGGDKPEELRELRREAAMGQLVCRVDPDDPRSAVLKVEITTPLLGFAFVSVLMLAGGCRLLMTGSRRISRGGSSA